MHNNMALPLFILLFFATSAISSPLTQSEENITKRFIEYYTEDGKPITIDLEAEPDYELLRDLQSDVDATQFWLYTRDNPETPQMLVYGDNFSVQSSNLKNADTIIVIHGWVSNGNTEPNPSIRRAYLEKYDANVVSVDWRRLAYSNYVTAVQGVPEVGKIIGQFITWLVNDRRYDRIHIVGFGLGAHIAGNAGRETGGRIARITGLDPERNLWLDNSNRLQVGDAIYVEAIHTDGGTNGYGIGTNIADMDFYPNGGKSQPNCYDHICNHYRSWQLFASSLTYNHFYGYLCTSNWQLEWNLCLGESNLMGNEQLIKTGSPGSYGVITAGRYPY